MLTRPNLLVPLAHTRELAQPAAPVHALPLFVSLSVSECSLYHTLHLWNAVLASPHL